jgi:hypothetical protein
MRLSILGSMIILTSVSACATMSPTIADVRTHLQAAIEDSEHLDGIVQRLLIFEEAGPSLRTVDPKLRQRLLRDIYLKISTSPEIIEITPLDNPRGTDKRKASKRTIDRDDLFRRFLKIISRCDPEEAIAYSKRYVQDHQTSSNTGYLWQIAKDELLDSPAESVRVASSAASSGDFGDVSLVYLEGLRDILPREADRIASIVMSGLPSLNVNSALELMTYVLPYPRIPELVAGRLLDKDIPDRTAPNNGRSSRTLLRRFISQATLGTYSSQYNKGFLFRVLRERVAMAAPELLPAVDGAVAEIFRDIPAVDQQNISIQVSRWSSSPDSLSNSIEGATVAYQTSGEEKYKNRAALLKALASARSGDFITAINTTESLPSESRSAAVDAVLLYASNTVKRVQDASALLRIARSDTHSAFIIAYTIVTHARLALAAHTLSDQDVAALLNEADQLVPQCDSTEQRFAIRLTVAVLWTRIDRDRAYLDTTSLLRDITTDTAADGSPFVNVTLPISGTVLEVNIPAGDSSLYGLVRILARSDIEQILARIDDTRRQDIRLRCIVAACAEYLNHVPGERKKL